MDLVHNLKTTVNGIDDKKMREEAFRMSSSSIPEKISP